MRARRGARSVGRAVVVAVAVACARLREALDEREAAVARVRVAVREEELHDHVLEEDEVDEAVHEEEAVVLGLQQRDLAYTRRRVTSAVEPRARGTGA